MSLPHRTNQTLCVLRHSCDGLAQINRPDQQATCTDTLPRAGFELVGLVPAWKISTACTLLASSMELVEDHTHILRFFFLLVLYDIG